jgi:hypothetical protein
MRINAEALRPFVQTSSPNRTTTLQAPNANITSSRLEAETQSGPGMILTCQP